MRINFNKQKYLKLLRLHKVFAVVIVGITLLLAALLLSLVFGLDQKVLTTPFQGIVSDTDGQRLPGAKIVFQAQTVETNNNGEFLFSDVDFGSHEIIISKNGFREISEKVRINRFKNYKEFVLEKQEFGEVSIILNTSIESADDLVVKINNAEFEIDENEGSLVVNTGRLLIGEYVLKVLSPEFLDFEEKFEVAPGESVKTIELKAAGDVLAEVRDFLTGKPVDKLIVKYKGEPLTKDQLEGHKIVIKDLELEKEVELVVQKEGFLDAVVKTDVRRGINSLGKIKLVREGRVLIPTDGSIFQANIDGSEPKELVSSSGKCHHHSTNGDFRLFLCGDDKIVIKNEGLDYKVVHKFTLASDKVAITESNGALIVIEKNKLVERTTGGGSGVLFEQVGEILSLATRGNDIYSSDIDGIYKLDRTAKQKVKIVSGSFSLQDISLNDGDALALSPNNRNAWLIEDKTKKVVKLNFLPSNYSKVRFASDGGIYYLKSTDLYLRISEQEEKLVQQNVENFEIVDQLGLLLTETPQGYYAIQFGTELPKKLNI